MKKVAVFGKPGSGKSTISKALALATGIELHQLDSLVYKANGEFVEREVFDLAHDNIINSEGWPDGSSVIKGTIQSYKTLKLCPKFWNDDFRARLELRAKEKEVHIIRSVSELNNFVRQHVT